MHTHTFVLFSDCILKKSIIWIGKIILNRPRFTRKKETSLCIYSKHSISNDNNLVYRLEKMKILIDSKNFIIFIGKVEISLIHLPIASLPIQSMCDQFCFDFAIFGFKKNEIISNHKKKAGKWRQKRMEVVNVNEKTNLTNRCQLVSTACNPLLSFFLLLVISTLIRPFDDSK